MFENIWWMMFPIEAQSPLEMHSTGQGRQMTIIHA
jgi:hypothetical protein